MSATKVGTLIVRQATANMNDGGNAAPTVKCQPGEKAIGGGGRTVATGPDIAQEASYPIDATGAVVEEGGTFSGWQDFFHNSIGPPSTDPVATIAYVLYLQ